MGIKGLNSLLQKYAPECIQTKNLDYFKGSTIAIDTSILLYKFKCHSNPNSHIYGFLKRALIFLQHGIIPIFVLDGKPPPEKYYILQKRNQKKIKIKEKIKLLQQQTNKTNETFKQIKKLSKQLINVTKEHHKEIYELLTYLGFHVIYSLGEAENTCAQLQKNGCVNYAYSDDMDLFPLGCSKILRNATKQSFTLIHLDKVLEILNITFSQLVDLCILCGCDYCPEIPRIKNIEALELIKKYEILENIPILKKNNINFNKARKLFECKNSKLKFNIVQLNFQEHKLKSFLLKKKINKSFIHQIIKQYKDCY